MIVQSLAYAGIDDFSGATRIILQIAGILVIVGTIIVIAGLVILATAHGPAGLFDGSRLPTAGFLVLAVVFAGAQLFFRVAPYIYTAEWGQSAAFINRGINIAIIVALLFAAVSMLVRSTLPVAPRVALFLPALVLIVIQFPLALSYPAYLWPQVVFHLTWVVVGILYLAARPLATRVPEASENLAE